ncbi:MAG: hypothetical protein ACI3WR_03225 [Oscillospiraceae bacterium]
MKRRICACMLCLCLCAALFGCAAEETVVGSWTGSGLVSVIDANAPGWEEVTETWTFSEDGTGTVALTAADREHPAVAFSWTLEDGVLTLTDGTRRQALSCTLEGGVMTLDAGGGPVVYERAE